MSEAFTAFMRIQEEAGAATSYFHTWWALRSLSRPDYLPVMNNFEFVDFFHAAQSGFIKLTFVSLAKIFDGDDRTLGVRSFRNILSAAGFQAESELLRQNFSPHTDLVSRVLAIRNRSVSHNEIAISRDEVYKLYGVTPDEIRVLIEDVRSTINQVGDRMGAVNGISDGVRSERAVLAMLEQLKRGAGVA